MHVFIYIACSNVVGTLALVAVELMDDRKLASVCKGPFVANFEEVSLHVTEQDKGMSL
jgi:hypothetical protein